MASHVFISHAAADRGAAEWWCRAIEADGMACWIAPRDVPPGADWAERIIRGIEAARAIVLLLSASAMESPQVRREIERAVHKLVPVIAMRLDDAPLSRSLEYFLSAQHWVDVMRGSAESRRAEVLFALHGFERGSIAAPASIPVAAASAAAAPAWPRVELARIAQTLAQHVGPVAVALVERAAPRAASRGQLIDLLAGEIDDPEARDRFVDASREA